MSEDKTFFSPIVLDGPFIDQCDFFVRKEQPASGSELRCTVNIWTPEHRHFEHEDDRYILVHDMRLHVELIEHVEGRPDEKVMHAHLTMRGGISVTDEVEATEEEILNSLLLNGVSLFYSSARTYIEFISGQSPMGRFTIPASYPKAYVDSLSE